MSNGDSRYGERRRALAENMAGQRIDALLVTNLIHVQYLTGFSGSNAAVIIHQDSTARIATDSRYSTQIAAEVPDLKAIIARPSATALLTELTGPLRVGIEASHVSMSHHTQLLEAAGEDVELVPVDGAVEKLRVIKDEHEVERLAEAAELASTALAQLLDAGEVAAGRTERQVAADLEYRMRLLGGDRPSFDTIVASGPHSAMPHHSANDRVLTDGDLVTIDFGVHVEGFNSDMTRTFVVGEANDFSQEIYDVVLRAQLAGIEAARPGTALIDVDKACRDIISNAGFGEYFVHSTGHGIGLEVHEAPSASTRGTGELAEGMTLTIEPGIYVPGRGGVRIEDTLVITSGAPRIITTGISKALTVV